MANEPDSGSTPVKPAMKKVMYKSPLSGIRSASYKPPVDKSGFKPIGMSSPKHTYDGTGDRFALNVEKPQPDRPRPSNLDNERTPNYGLDAKPSPTGDSLVINPSLMGRGGHWRGPQGSDMSPETRRGGRPRRRGYNSSPSSEGIAQWYSPVQNVNDSSTGNDSFGHNFRHNNFRNNSFGSMSNSPRGQFNSPHSPRGQFNSSDRSRNSPRNNNRRGSGNRGGNHGHRSNGDISVFYSSLMNVDPWADLIREKMSVSSFQTETLNRDSKSILNVNLSSDSDMDEGIESQENDTPVGDDSV